MFDADPISDLLILHHLHTQVTSSGMSTANAEALGDVLQLTSSARCHSQLKKQQ